MNSTLQRQLRNGHNRLSPGSIKAEGSRKSQYIFSGIAAIFSNVVLGRPNDHANNHDTKHWRRRRKRLGWTLAAVLAVYLSALWMSTVVVMKSENEQTSDRIGLRGDFVRSGRTGGSTRDNTGQGDHRRPFISYQLHHGDRPYNITFGHQTTCKLGRTTNKWGRKPIDRVPLAPPLQEILNVTTTFSTNLKILSVGDSVGMQIHEMLEEASGVTWETRHVYQNAWGQHESVSVSELPTGSDGSTTTSTSSSPPGILAAFRMTGMLLKAGKGGKPPNAGPVEGAGGWLPDHVQQLLNHTTTHTEMKTTATVSTYDSMIFRIPHGWLTLDHVTHATIRESLLLAKDLFGIRTAIVQTLFLNNNVKTNEELEQLRACNKMIRKLVESWDDPALPIVLLMDIGGWTDALTKLNAQLAGMDTTSTTNENFTLARLQGAKFPPSIAMACSKTVKPGSKTCTRNMLSIDGMHWCMESMGGRIVAAIVCLLKCSLLPMNENHKQSLRTCEEDCNSRFMSMKKAATLHL